MEILKLSKFKLQIRALIAEVHQLNERERLAKEQLEFSIQKQKQTEEEFSRKITELHAELGLSNELRQKLERKVSCLVTENDLLENKHRELKETITNLLRSKEGFAKIYEDSFSDMKQMIEAKDRKIEILSEKIKSHSLLVYAIEKEANSIKKVLDNTECIVKEREDVVVGLKRKVEEITTFETLFIKKIKDLECKLKNDEDELKRKDKIILDLEAQLDTSKLTKDFQPKIHELQKALSVKELYIHNLISEKKALQSEVGHLSFTLMKVQDAVSHMDEENRRTFSSVLEAEEKFVTIRENEVSRFGDVQKFENVSDRDTCSNDAVENTASSFSENPSVLRSLKEDKNDDSCASEMVQRKSANSSGLRKSRAQKCSYCGRVLKGKLRRKEEAVSSKAEKALVKSLSKKIEKRRQDQSKS